MHKKKVITYGTFDLFHIGHVRLLKRLAELGDHLTVFVSTDEFNLEKGKSSVVAYEDRAEIVRACRYVDCVLPEKRWDQKYDDIIREGISVFGMGDDWTGKFDELEGICEVVFLDRTENVSSTTLKSFIKSLGREELLEALPVIDEKLVPNFDSEKTMLSQVKSVVSLGNISNKDYHRLFAELEENHDDRSLEWLQAWILLHCAAQKKPYPTQKFISKLGRISRRRGQTDSYHTFLSYVVDEMSFLLPNGGKYTQSFRSVDIDEIIQKCTEVVETLTKEGLSVFANSGTLLGLVRDNSLIAHDNDIDLGLILTARTEKEAAEEWRSLCEKLVAKGIAKSRSEWSKVTLKLEPICGFGVDLFPAWISAEDTVYVYPHTYGNLKKSQLLPLKAHRGTNLQIPADAESMIVSNYGKDWRVPDEGWTFSWPAANEKFEQFIKFVS